MAISIRSSIRSNASTTMQGDRLMSSSEVCAYLHISRKTLQRYVRDGLISYVRFRGILRFRKSAVDYFVSQNEVKV